MIQLNLRQELPRRGDDERVPVPDVSLERIERTLHQAMFELSLVVDERRRTTTYVPSDMLLHASTALMPAERMGIIAGRWIGHHFLLTTLYDVTGAAHRAHVRADPDALGRALLAFERTGAELAGWIHSHPGSGPLATSPSRIDREQYEQWKRDFGSRLLGIILVRDGHVRLWGDGIETGRVRVELLGNGITPVLGHHHVYRLHV